MLNPTNVRCLALAVALFAVTAPAVLFAGDRPATVSAQLPLTNRSTPVLGPKPAAAEPSVHAGTSMTVNIGPIGFTRTCDLHQPRKCDTSASVTFLGATGSFSTNGDMCGGGSLVGGSAIYGKASVVSCRNLKDGSQATKISVGVGTGVGLDAISGGVTAGSTVTFRRPR